MRMDIVSRELEKSQVINEVSFDDDAPPSMGSCRDEGEVLPQGLHFVQHFEDHEDEHIVIDLEQDQSLSLLPHERSNHPPQCEEDAIIDTHFY